MRCCNSFKRLRSAVPKRSASGLVMIVPAVVGKMLKVLRKSCKMLDIFREENKWSKDAGETERADMREEFQHDNTPPHTNTHPRKKTNLKEPE